MDHPDEPVSVSTNKSDDDPASTEDRWPIVIENEDDEPIAILEKWSADCWIYAEEDDLKELN